MPAGLSRPHWAVTICFPVPTHSGSELRSFRNAAAIAALQDEAQLTLNSYIHTRSAPSNPSHSCRGDIPLLLWQRGHNHPGFYSSRPPGIRHFPRKWERCWFRQMENGRRRDFPLTSDSAVGRFAFSKAGFPPPSILLSNANSDA